MSTKKSPLWAVSFDKPAQRAIGRLPEKIAAAVIEYALHVLPENPERMSKPLHYDLEGLRVARRGSYRLLHEIDESSRVIHVIDIDHRDDIYRPR